MKTTPELVQTSDYDMFEAHKYNRNIHKDNVLLESMKKHGFAPSRPIQVTESNNGKLTIVSGHHRFYAAKQLNIPVWYVIDDTLLDPYDAEGSSYQRWTSENFIHSYARRGNKQYKKLLSYMNNHGLKTKAAAALLVGGNGEAGNICRPLKSGTFGITNLHHADRVTGITDFCREIGVNTPSALVYALSVAVRIPGFDSVIFCKKLANCPKRLNKRGTCKEYLEEVEKVYNYGTKTALQLQIQYEAKKLASKYNGKGQSLTA